MLCSTEDKAPEWIVFPSHSRSTTYDSCIYLDIASKIMGKYTLEAHLSLASNKKRAPEAKSPIEHYSLYIYWMNNPT
jgi:hypothetical protein